jgi:hypothetical protein
MWDIGQCRDKKLLFRKTLFRSIGAISKHSLSKTGSVQIGYGQHVGTQDSGSIIIGPGTGFWMQVPGSRILHPSFTYMVMEGNFSSKFVLILINILTFVKYKSKLSRGIICVEKQNPVGTHHNFAQGL